jgi:hypothetical protein
LKSFAGLSSNSNFSKCDEKTTSRAGGLLLGWQKQRAGRLKPQQQKHNPHLRWGK